MLNVGVHVNVTCYIT